MIVDAHWDTVLHYRRRPSLERAPEAHVDWRRLRQTVDIGFAAVYIARDAYPGEAAYTEYRRLVQALKDDLAALEHGVRLLSESAQLDLPGQKWLLLGAEGAHFLGTQQFLPRLEEARQEGLRFLGPTWNYRTVLAGGCQEGGGLTALGAEVVKYCNQWGILVDGAHLSPQSLSDILRLSEKPVVVSHTACAALCPAFAGRNLSDAQLQELAEAGGVAGLCFVPDFLGGTPSVARVAEHIEHAVTVAGVDHVGIGSDFDGAPLPPDMAGLQSLPLLWQELRARGFRQADIDKIAGDNFVRVLRQVLPSG